MGGVSFKRAKEYLAGYVVVEVRGKNPERLVNLCLSKGFPVWDFVVKGDKAVFSTSLSRYMGIRPLARKARCTPRVIRRVGLPFLLGRLGKRPFLVWSSVLAVLALIYISGSVWAIEVKGAQSVDGGRVLEAAHKAGLDVGIRKSKIPSDLELHLIKEFPQISWAYVRCHGTRVVIEIVEKSRREMEMPGDIVAAKDGIIQSILVLSGTPAVRPGDVVREGQMLITGYTAGEIKGARGTIIADTFYQVRIEVPLEKLVPSRTGRKAEVKLVCYRGREWALTGRKSMFEWYEIEDYPVAKLMLPGGNYGSASLQVINRVFYELSWALRILEPEEAVDFAKKEARKYVEKQLPSSAELVDFNCVALPSDAGSVYVRIIARAQEEIGCLRQWPGQNREVDR